MKREIAISDVTIRYEADTYEEILEMFLEVTGGYITDPENYILGDDDLGYEFTLEP